MKRNLNKPTFGSHVCLRQYSGNLQNIYLLHKCKILLLSQGKTTYIQEPSFWQDESDLKA